MKSIFVYMYMKFNVSFTKIYEICIHIHYI